jgi:anti-anti-sigma regulatory factor
MIDDAEAEGRVTLPVNVTTVLAEDLRARLVFAADHDEAIIIDAARMESIGQAAIQLLIAARHEAERLDLPFRIENLQPAVVARLAALGLAQHLEMTVEEELAL